MVEFNYILVLKYFMAVLFAKNFLIHMIWEICVCSFEGYDWPRCVISGFRLSWKLAQISVSVLKENDSARGENYLFEKPCKLWTSGNKRANSSGFCVMYLLTLIPHLFSNSKIKVKLDMKLIYIILFYNDELIIYKILKNELYFFILGKNIKFDKIKNPLEISGFKIV